MFIRILPLFFLFQFACVSLSGSDVKDEVAQGNEYAKDGLLREAAETYRKVLKKNPKLLGARRNLGIVLVKAGSYQAAAAQLERVIGRFDNDFEANHYLGEAYRAGDKFAEAIYRYQKALNIRPNSLRTMKALAWSYFKIRYYGEALTIARKMRKQEPQDPQVSIILARTLLQLGKPKTALSILSKAKAKSTKESIPYFQSVEGDILLAMDRCTKAITAYRAALKVQPLLAGSLLGLGKCHLKIGKVTQGIDYVERAIRLRPNMAEGIYLLAQTLESRDPKKSIKYYQHFRKIAGQDPTQLDKVKTINARVANLRKKISSTRTRK